MGIRPDQEVTSECSCSALIELYEKQGLDQIDARKLLAHCDNHPRRLRRWLHRRLLGEPMETILGRVELCGREFLVDGRVYVPNRQSEMLVDLALEADADSYLDVGTGCGWIAISLKLSRPRASVAACDVDPGALRVASENIARHAVDVELWESYYVDDVGSPEPDVIVADLPYGNEDVVLRAGGAASLRSMPPVSLFHPGGILASLHELLDSIRRRGWSPRLLIETGKLEPRNGRPVPTYRPRVDLSTA